MGTTFYTADHVWIRIQSDDQASQVGTVGITRFAQDALGSIVFVSLPKRGSEVVRRQACCVVESTKTAADVIDPASGTVTEINESLDSDVAPLNDDPLGTGWLYRIAIPHAEPPGDGWMDEASYQAFCKA
jgi:glycine cleavage system H protein